VPKFGPAFREIVELAPRVQATSSDVLPVLAAAAFAPHRIVGAEVEVASDRDGAVRVDLGLGLEVHRGAPSERLTIGHQAEDGKGECSEELTGHRSSPFG